MTPLSVSLKRQVFVSIVFFIAIASGLQAKVRVSGLFTDNMVLQRNHPIKVWGWANPGDKLSISFGGATSQVTCTPEGIWLVSLPAMKETSKADHLKVENLTDKKGIELKNIVIGDVWLCSGQSNMELTLSYTRDWKTLTQDDDLPLIRHVKIPNARTDAVQPDVTLKTPWTAASPSTVGEFTAVGYYFGRKVHRETGVPIGIISSNLGGTKVEPWLPLEAFSTIPELQNVLKNYIRGRENHPEVDPNTNHQAPARMYNAMIYPLHNFPIKGVLWYQGEGSTSDKYSYQYKLTALIESWRKLWNCGAFSFYFVQLPSCKEPTDNPEGGDGWAPLREAQRKTLELPNTGMAVTIDIGEGKDIHPKNKRDVGERLALWSLAKDYGKSIVYSGPLFRAFRVEGSCIRLKFDQAQNGMMVGLKKGMEPTQRDDQGKLKRFAIAGKDKQWAWAEATIDGSDVIVSSPQVTSPVAVRYAFSMNPEGANLYNVEGLPASPFRTDDW